MQAYGFTSVCGACRGWEAIGGMAVIGRRQWKDQPLKAHDGRAVLQPLEQRPEDITIALTAGRKSDHEVRDCLKGEVGRRRGPFVYHALQLEEAHGCFDDDVRRLQVNGGGQIMDGQERATRTYVP